MRLLPPLLGITRLDHQRSTDIRKSKLNVLNLIFGDSQRNWIQHIRTRIQNTKTGAEYKPLGQRDPPTCRGGGENTPKGLKPNPAWFMMMVN